MKLDLSAYPCTYLAVTMEPNEQIISEKGALIYCEGAYSYENKIEAKSYKNWVAKLLGGKSLTYNIYTAQEPLRMILSTKDNAEIFLLDVDETNPILFEPNLHLARTTGVGLKLENTGWKSTLNDGLKLATVGSGQLALKGYGKIIKQEIDTDQPVLIDESALIAFEQKLEVKTISKGVKELITSGEGFMFAVKGKGNVWLQTREKAAASSGGLVSGIFSFMK